MSLCLSAVTMTIILTFCSHTILQKSAMVLCIGAWVQMKSLSDPPPFITDTHTHTQSVTGAGRWRDRQAVQQEQLDTELLQAQNLRWCSRCVGWRFEPTASRDSGHLQPDVVRKWKADTLKSHVATHTHTHAHTHTHTHSCCNLFKCDGRCAHRAVCRGICSSLCWPPCLPPWSGGLCQLHLAPFEGAKDILSTHDMTHTAFLTNQKKSK